MATCDIEINVGGGVGVSDGDGGSGISVTTVIYYIVIRRFFLLFFYTMFRARRDRPAAEWSENFGRKETANPTPISGATRRWTRKKGAYWYAFFSITTSIRKLRPKCM